MKDRNQRSLDPQPSTIRSATLTPVNPEAEFMDVIVTKVLKGLFTVSSTNGFYSPAPLSKGGLKLVLMKTLYMETLNIMARNLNEMVCS